MNMQLQSKLTNVAVPSLFADFFANFLYPNMRL